MTMNSIKYISCRNWSHNVASRLQSTVASAEKSTRDIKIPPRIERSPTDILRALSEAVPANPNSYHYKFMDDRYFRPASVGNKVDWALAREWGKRAAHFVHHEHHDLFPKPLDNTQIPILENLYFPQSKDEVSEELLMNSIANGRMELAIHIYELLEEDVSIKAKVALLELLCYYNGRVPTGDETYPEYRFYVLKPQRQFKEWINGKRVQKLFNFLSQQEDPATLAASYNALICGMSKFGNGSDALKYYEKCVNENIPLHINTYNELFKKIEFLHPVPEERPKVLNNLLRTMLKSSVRANSTTMNNCMRAAVIFYPGSRCKNVVQSLVQMFQMLGVQRSLGSYYYEICSIAESGESGEAIGKILSEVANRKFEVEDTKDLQFFTGTMEFLSYELESADYALLLHKIFNSNNSEKFIGNTSSERKYYEALLSVVLHKKSFTEFGELYKALVPHTHIPTTKLTMTLLERLKAEKLEVVAQYLPSLLETTVQLTIWLSIETYCSLTELMLTCCSLDEFDSLRETCAKNAWDFYEQIVNGKDHLSTDELLGQCVLNAALLQLYAEKAEEAVELLNTLPKLYTPENRHLSKEKIDKLLDVCLKHRFYGQAIVFLECLVGCEHAKVNSYAKKLANHLAVDAPEKKKLLRLVGDQVLQA